MPIVGATTFHMQTRVKITQRLNYNINRLQDDTICKKDVYWYSEKQI